MPSRLSQFAVVALRADGDDADDDDDDYDDDDYDAAAPQGFHSLVTLRIMVRHDGTRTRTNTIPYGTEASAAG